MKAFKNILFIADTEELGNLTEAVAHALALAKNNGGSLTIADVIEPTSKAATMVLEKVVAIPRLTAFKEEERRQELGDFIDHEALQAVDYPVKCQVATGTPYVEIIRMVIQNEYDLVIKVAHKSNIAGQLFGSTDLHLLRKCPCPVWLIKDEKPTAYTNVLAAVDVSRQGAEHTDINATILRLASSFAQVHDSELHIVQCWDLPSDNLLKRALDKFVPEDKQAWSQLTEKNFHHRINPLLSPYEIQKSQLNLHLKQGDPKEMIPYMAQKHHCDLIIMGTLHRAGVEGLIIGSTAESVLRQIKTSVLAVKPEGFQSPLQGSLSAPSSESTAA